MIWHDDSEEYELASGTRFYANNGILGIGPTADAVSHGADGDVGDVGTKNYFTKAEREEMAAEMIRRWSEWAT